MFFNLTGKAHDGEHNAFHTGAGFPLDIVNRFRFHFLLDQIFKFQRDGGKAGK